MDFSTNTKTKKSLRILSIGDLHLGHRHTPSETIINNLDRKFNHPDRLKHIDIIFINGDVFDRLLHNSDDQVHVINRWITRVLWLCARYDVLIRIVEGTSSHDWKQSRFFIEQATNAKIPVDIHYATTLSIEVIERFQMSVLYVPDKWQSDTSQTLAEVRQLMHQKGLDQVDFASMHGAFEYQLPSIVPEPVHDSKAYHELVRHYIMINHVHTSTQQDRILAPGSFDRLKHGEEHPKGFFDITLTPRTSKVVFIENEHAKQYVALHASQLTTVEFNDKVRRLVAKLPKHSAIMVRCQRQDVATQALPELRKLYPQFEWSSLIEEDKKKQEHEDRALFEVDFTNYPEITRTSITELIQVQLDQRVKGDDQNTRCLGLLEGLLNE